MSLACQWEQTPFASLSTFGTLFSSLSALWGAYCILFIMAIWATFQHEGPAQKRLRMVAVALFFVLLTHYLSRAITFGRARVENHPTTQAGLLEQEAKWDVPLMFINDLTSTIAGTISDGLLAWRFYVVWNRSRWALYVPTIAVCINAMLGLSGNFMYLVFYHSASVYNTRFKLIAFQIYSAWAWCMLGINTLFTSLMVWKIIRVSRKTQPTSPISRIPYPYTIAVEAIAESALVMWIGLVVYGISSVAPQGKITTHWDIGFIMSCTLPMFFGISQCLITARLGFVREGSRLDGGRRVTCGCPDSPSPTITVVVRQDIDVDISSGCHVSLREEKPDCIV